jgi:hypothetical protein
LLNNQRIGSENPEGRALGRPRHRWEDIKIYLREIGLENVD